jgi:hypothetical protein
VLANEDSWLIRTNAGRRQAIKGCHGRRKRRSRSWRGCEGIEASFTLFGWTSC